MALEIRIASPCSEKWESMSATADARARHCLKCKLNVFNVKDMTEDEVRALFQKTEGRVCGRIFQRRDGTVLTRDCPTGLAAIRRRMWMGVSLAVTVVLTVVGFRFGKKECSTDGGMQSWFDRVVASRFIEVREELRDTKTFGAAINELWPPVRMYAGEMVALPPPAPTPPTP